MDEKQGLPPREDVDDLIFHQEEPVGASQR